MSTLPTLGEEFDDANREHHTARSREEILQSHGREIRFDEAQRKQRPRGFRQTRRWHEAPLRACSPWQHTHRRGNMIPSGTLCTPMAAAMIGPTDVNEENATANPSGKL